MLDKDDYEDKLSDDLCDKEEYRNLSDEEYNKNDQTKNCRNRIRKSYCYLYWVNKNGGTIMVFPIQLINEDGTDVDYNYPENPLEKKWNKLYPPIPKPEYSQVCDGYSCMCCGRCPKGSYWEVPEEDKDLWNKYQKQIMEYHKIHNPSLYKMMT